MKIVSIETLRITEFANVIWVRVHTDAGVIGLGETFHGAGAVESHIHDTLAGRLVGRNPLHIEALHREMLNLPMAQSSTGVEYRAASAIDIAATWLMCLPAILTASASGLSRSPPQISQVLAL